ncbi:TOMM precursor leader peptide-binding protein [Streptoalloteichus hindustanus]|uniref:TOMM precursor leader peptide-binding protein n=1 Tax=Streptoalloteichus hindustanus TaxID=2017 RepID=UPI0013566989|nr:TOMM precursor leader peptide-binding protein [Streptoalloteichus hindustanus]
MEWQDLPDTAVSALVERGLLVPADQPLRRHPSFGASATGAVHVPGEDPLSAAVTAVLGRIGVAVESGLSPRVAAVVLPLSTSEDGLRNLADWSMREKKPVITFAVAGARTYFAVLRPPRTACPACLERRIRATRPDQSLARLPVETLLGAWSDDFWPSSTAAAGLIAHQVVRAMGTGDDDSAEFSETNLVEANLDTCERINHPLLHLPFCPVCADRVPPVRRELRDTSPVSTERSWQRMRRAVDPITGVLSGIRVYEPGEPGSTVDSTVVWGRGGTDTRWFSPVRASCIGGSTKHDPVDARVCAIGEVLERYAAGIYDPARFVRASLSELGPKAVDPRELPLGSEREYEAVRGVLFPYEPDLVIDWVEGVELDTGESRYVPAIAVHLPYVPPNRQERLLHPNSTGTAAGSVLPQAVRGGLLEIVERDAAAVFWYNQLVVPTVDWSTLDPGPARTVLERMRSRGIELVAKDITTDLGIPAMVVLGRIDTPERPVALCGYRADLDLRSCLLGAAQELEHVFCMYWRSRELGGEPSLDEPRDIWDFTTYYCHESRVSLLDFMREGPVRPLSAEAPERLSDVEAMDQVVERLSVAGHHPVAVDITPIDVAECGVSVVHCVVPGLQPVGFSTTFRRLGGRRLYEAPVRMGLRDRELAEHELTPHPIPMG